MAKKMEKHLIIAIVLLLYVNRGSAIMCYTCVDFLEDDCGEDFESGDIEKVECDGKRDVCMIHWSPAVHNVFKCFKCTSLITPSCKDPFNATQLTLTEDCNYDYQVCLKQEIPATYYMVDHEVRRGCVNEDYCISEEKRSSHCSTCRSYLCNASDCLSSIMYMMLSLCFALRCFSCNSAPGGPCDEFPSKSLATVPTIECPNFETTDTGLTMQCVKIKGVDKNQKSYVTRNCVTENFCTLPKSTHSVCETCKDDLCFALKCFICNSELGGVCDEFPSKLPASVQPMNCPNFPIPGAGTVHCAKVKGFDNNQKGYVIRSCVPENFCTLSKSKHSECDICNSDLCFGLQCYTCSSALGEFCDDKFSFNSQATVPIMNCENSPLIPIPGAGPNTHCGKTKRYDEKSHDYVTRGCVPENYCRLVKSKMSECKLCENERCNSSTSLLPSILLCFAISIIVYLKF
ncbi:hypothetical protein FQR65_LT01833 [Abscondita terminalis]|nr:hypothetical protein FQR65_LT01833 [Abscondita terminalis]